MWWLWTVIFSSLSEKPQFEQGCSKLRLLEFAPMHQHQLLQCHQLALLSPCYCCTTRSALLMYRQHSLLISGGDIVKVYGPPTNARKFFQKQFFTYFFLFCRRQPLLVPLLPSCLRSKHDSTTSTHCTTHRSLHPLMIFLKNTMDVRMNYFYVLIESIIQF